MTITEIGLALFGIFLVASLGVLVGAILSLPFALYNKVRRGKFGVGRATRTVLSTCGVGIVIMLIVSAWPGADYTARAQVSEGASLTSQYKMELAEYFAAHKSFDGVSVGDLGGTTTGRFVSSVEFRGARGDVIAVVATFHPENSHKKIQGKEFRIATLDGGVTWLCGMQIPDSGLRGTAQVSERELPSKCR